MFAAGRANTPASTPVYVEELFSAYSYTGDATSRAITNDIALGSTAAWQTRTLKDGTTTRIYKIKKDSAGNYIALGNSTVSGTVRILLIKFDSAWGITWQKRLTDSSGAQEVNAESLALDTSDNIYVSYGDTIANIAKFNSSGTLQWARNIAPSTGGFQQCTAITYNTVDGYLYIGGRISGPSGQGMYAKYSTAGVVQWMKMYKPDGTYYGNQLNGVVSSIAHDSTGNVYFCGAEFDTAWRGHVVKINSSGAVQWNKRVSTANRNNVDTIFIDSSDGIYLGYYDGDVFSNTSYAYTDVHTLKLNTSGAVVWDRKIKGYPSGLCSITGDSSGNIYTAFGATLTKHNSSGTLQWSRRLYTSLFYGVSALDTTVYATGLGTTNGFITELASDGTTKSGNAYHGICEDLSLTDSAGGTSVTNGTSVVTEHTGTESATTPTITTASTTATLYSQAAVVGYGGLTWLKGRSGGSNNVLLDTVRGTNSISSNNTDGNIDPVPNGGYVTGFNVNGFSLGTNGSANNSGTTYISWTFRKQPKFFDIVTYTGNGITGMINHNLGSIPGMIIYKNTSTTNNWCVYHRSLGGTKALFLNRGDLGADTGSGYFGNQTATSTQFPVGNNDLTNGTGTFIAYIFAHNAGGFGLTGADNIITCGSFTTDGSGNATANLGYVPQWYMYKGVDAAGGNYDGGFHITDSTRGWNTPSGSNAFGVGQNLSANSSGTETGFGVNGWPTETGFAVGQLQANKEYVYVAIRKGPMKIPTVGTSVFNTVLRTGTSAAATVSGVGFPTDLVLSKTRTPTGNNPSGIAFDRLRGITQFLNLAATSQETTGSGTTDFTMDGYKFAASASDPNLNTYTYSDWNFRCAPGFFDTVAYAGGLGARDISHALGVTPEFIIVKLRTGTTLNWRCFHKDLGINKYIDLNASNAADTNATTWRDMTPTTFGVKATASLNENSSAYLYIAYLFASLPGVSKVGSYAGTGAAQAIDCGFTAGARFVLIKRSDGTGDWYAWDTARGIVSGNDPYLITNLNESEVTNTDYIDPSNAGFEISASAPSAINASGGTFIFLAIA